MGRRDVEGQLAFELTWEPKPLRPTRPAPPTGNHRRALENLEILRLARRLEDTGEAPTPDEQQLLARFTPWSAIPEVLDPEAAAPWVADVRAALADLLTGDELEALG